MKIALTISENFDRIKAYLLPVIGAVVFREKKHLSSEFDTKDVLFHTNGFINNGFDILVNNNEILKKLNLAVKFLSFDLGPSCTEVQCPEEGYIAKSSVLNENQILSVAKKKIANIRKYFKGQISVENLDYHPTGAYEIVCDPDFISRFIDKFNVGLTLDIGHIEVTCNNLAVNEYDYIDQLPLQFVKEIHISRSSGQLDAHLLPDEKEYRLLDYILKKTQTDYIVLEYYKCPRGIIEGNIKLSEFLKKREIYEN